MQRLSQIADRVAAHRHVLDQSQDTNARFGRHVGPALEILVEKCTKLGMLQLLFGRRCAHQATGQVLREPSHFEGHLGDMMLADVRQHVVVQVTA